MENSWNLKNDEILWKIVLGISRENHYRLSEHISRLIIDCTIEMYVPLTLTSEVIKNAQFLTM